MKRIAFVIPFAGLLLCVGMGAEPGLKTTDDPLEGIYEVVGEGDNPYTGSATIRKRGDGYLIQVQTTTFDDGEILGIGTAHGPALRVGNTLSFSWRQGEQ